MRAIGATFFGEHTIRAYVYAAGAQLRSHGVAAGVVDITGSDDQEPLRGNQIRRWLEEHPEVEAFVVIDDDTVSMGDLAPHVVHTDSTCGLSDQDVEKAVEAPNMTPFETKDLLRGRP